jgi:hypothetical protein
MVWYDATVEITLLGLSILILYPESALDLSNLLELAAVPIGSQWYNCHLLVLHPMQGCGSRRKGACMQYGAIRRQGHAQGIDPCLGQEKTLSYAN